MASYKMTLSGTADADDVRQTFEQLVRELRPEGAVTGALELDGVPYDAADVTEEAAGLDSDDADAPDEPGEGDGSN